MCEWLVWTFRPVPLLHVDGNVNLYVNVIQQTGYRHQSYLWHVEYSKITPSWLLCKLCNINIHLPLPLLHIMRIITSSVYPAINVAIIIVVREWRYDRESEGECHLIPEVSPCVSSQERPSQSWIVSFQRLVYTSCHNTITFSSLCIPLTYTYTHLCVHTGAYLILCTCFVFRRCRRVGVGPSASSASLYLSKLDAGPRCLTAPVKLWCDCLILGFTHLVVFTVIILNEGRRDRLNGGIWFSDSSPGQWCPDQWRVEDGWSVRERDLKSPHFQSHIPEGMVLPDEWSLLKRRS